MDGIILTPLKRINHPKGDIFHAMKKTDLGFEGFGEAYFSTINEIEPKSLNPFSLLVMARLGIGNPPIRSAFSRLSGLML